MSGAMAWCDCVKVTLTNGSVTVFSIKSVTFKPCLIEVTTHQLSFQLTGLQVQNIHLYQLKHGLTERTLKSFGIAPPEHRHSELLCGDLKRPVHRRFPHNCFRFGALL